MSCQIIILFSLFALVTLFSNAAEVEWNATGAVNVVRGEDFLSMAASGDPVTVELRYNNGSEGEIFRQIFDLNDQLFWQQEEYYQSVNLDIVITIGLHTWRGTLESGSPGPPYTIEVQDVKVAGDAVDRFRLTVSEDDGGSFPLFPGELVATDNPRIQIEFSDSSVGSDAVPSYLDSTDLTCVSQSFTRITAARGFISSGSGDIINFTVDPESIRTRMPNLELVELREVTYDAEFDEVVLRWGSVPGKFYVIQYLAEDLCWREKSSTQAQSAETTWAVLPSGETELYRIVEEE
tara:strand:+ start:1849 stop:2727 length:879 start_codon:yes stop_codon:yes gene_type:complete